MNINTTKDNTALTVFREGRLDTATSPSLDETLKAQMPGISELVIDMEKLEYLSSAGLRVLLSAQKIMNKQGSMTVRNVNETIMEIFDITGFSDILTIQ
ncbi:MAG: STAS domain-containing protein [Clostridia bacterium]|nr:STAS domain-containing protein [Clostridia bacterium]